MNFSVLMSIYYKEKVEYFNCAMISIWDKQIIKPNEIILVQDGPLTDELYENIEAWSFKLLGVLKIVIIDNNIGLGDALNLGLKHCTNELVARMDTDDIAHPERFKKQLEIFKKNNFDACSSWVSEFEGSDDNIISYRKVPKSHDEISHFAKKKNPMNHPSVMYKKSSVLASGSYQKMLGFEDYCLWARMLTNGASFHNIQEPLVNMRAGYSQLERRRGFNYAVNEVALQKKFLAIKFINKFEFIRNVTIRFIVRVAPPFFVKSVYKILRS